MTDQPAKDIGAEGAQIKRDITEDKKRSESKVEPFDPGAAMLGTDNEAGSQPDPGGMAEARKASRP
jgi:hypothetical protein